MERIVVSKSTVMNYMKRPTDKTEEQEWIEQYLLGKMTKEEALFFENELRKDKNLVADMQTIQQVHSRIQEAFLEKNALHTIKKLQKKDRTRAKIVLISKYTGYVAAACAAFILYLSFAPSQFPDSENDFTVVRTEKPSTMTVQQRYIFDQFFEGQAHIAEGQYSLAIQNLEEVVRFNDLRPYFREAAQWHLAIAYLKSGNAAKAEQLYHQFQHCTECEYSVEQVDQWKVWWQIQKAKFF